MGRPAKTVRQHLLQGTVPQGRTAPDSKYAGGRPKVPRHLSPEARAEFKRAVRFLEQRGTITEQDYFALTVYATLFARWLQAKSEIGKELLIVTAVLDNNGIAHSQKKLNPLLKVVEACESRLLALTKSLGLTPIDRDRVKPTAGSNDDDPSLIPGTVAYYRKHNQETPAPIAIVPTTLEDGEETEHGA